MACENYVSSWYVNVAIGCSWLAPIIEGSITKDKTVEPAWAGSIQLFPGSNFLKYYASWEGRGTIIQFYWVLTHMTITSMAIKV